MNVARVKILAALSVVSVLLAALPADAHVRTAARVPAQATAVASKKPLRKTVKVVAPRSTATTKKSAVKSTKTPTTTKKRRTVATATVSSSTVAPSTVPPTTPVVTTPAVTTSITILITPIPVDTTPVVVAVGVTVPATDPTTTTLKPPVTTLVPAVFPAPANAPLRPSAATADPYRGLGTWLDRFDWTTQWSKKPIPPVTAATVDAMWAQGVQTIYIQASHWSTVPDVLEPEKLQPIIDRAHQLGMYVVVWYLPAFQDANTDLRKVVAIANLDVDGISIDIEERDVVKDVAERTRRLISFTQSLRGLLPGRFLSNNIIEPLALDGVPGIWTLPNGQPPPPVALWWRGPFPYVEIAPAFDLWMIQSYWTNRGANTGWRDGYRYVSENVNRLRRVLNRPDLPVHVIGGVGDKSPALNDVSGMLQAAREVNSMGLSFYDWLVTNSSLWQYLRAFRAPGPDGLYDQRFPAVTPPAYVPSQPPPVTTTTIAPPVVVVTAPPMLTVAPTLPPVAVVT